MSIDAVAVLHITGLIAPLEPWGTRHPVRHSSDASLVNTMIRFHAQAPDDHALSLRRMLGPALDAHDDPRGILFFPDVSYPKSTGYDAIVEETSEAGFWTPKVGANYVPLRYSASQASNDPHDLLVREMIETMGRDEAVQFDLMAQVSRRGIIEAPERADFGETYRNCLERVTGAMGADFANRYTASLQQKAEASPRSMAASTVPILLEEVPVQMPPVSDNPLFEQIVATIGYDAALNRHLQVLLSHRMSVESPERTELAEMYQQSLEALVDAMGADFAARYVASLEEAGPRES
jgi:hypothetical protein